MNDMTGAGWTTLSGSGIDNTVQGVFVDKVGQIYVVESSSGRIGRMKDMTGTGWTSLQFSNGSFIFVDRAGRIYVT
jgi:hypothetical protein